MSADKFDSLRSKLAKGRLLLPGDDGFEQSLERWSATCVKPAAAVAQPATVEEVSAVVKFARAHDIAFNVKGGGHSTSQVSGAPSPEGMVLDLALMRGVSVDTTNQTVSFEGGCLWQDVDGALWPHGLATPGGTVSHTGVGGLVLHGGFGVLSGLHGLTIDVLLSCQVVLADGSIVTASEEENPDLFWGIRGAGSSFGVVTQFTSKAFPQGNIWASHAVFPIAKLPEIVEFINFWGENNAGVNFMLVAITHAPPAPGADAHAPRPRIVFIQMCNVSKEAEMAGPEFFQKLLEIETLMKKVGPMPYPVINTTGDQGFKSGSRYMFGGANFTIPLKVSTAETIRDRFYGFIDENPDCLGSMLAIECIGTEKIRSVPSDSTAFNNRGDYYNIGIVYKWEDEGLDQLVRSFNREIQGDIRKLGYDDKSLKDGVGMYLNYVGSDSITAENAFGSNADRLRALKKKYDPSNTFDKLWKLVGKAEDH